MQTAMSYGAAAHTAYPDRERSLHGREVFGATPSINGTAQCEARRAERLAANKASSRQRADCSREGDALLADDQQRRAGGRGGV